MLRQASLDDREETSLVNEFGVDGADADEVLGYNNNDDTTTDINQRKRSLVMMVAMEMLKMKIRIGNNRTTETFRSG